MEQIKPLREMTGKERVQYIWDYYKVTFLVVALCILVAGGFLYHYISYREPVLELMMINLHQTDSSELEESFADFVDANGYDSAKDSVEINSMLNLDTSSGSDYDDQITMQTLIASMTYSGFFADETVFSFYSPAGYFRDLSALLSEEELSILSDRLVYGRTENDDTPYPCGIYLDTENCPWLEKSGYDSCYFGILYGDASDELVTALIRYVVFGEL
jgi:hypothetical protein